MGFFDDLKNGIELKQNSQNQNSTKIHDRILKLEKELESDPENISFLVKLYGCYVKISNTPKKIECMKKMAKFRPKDSYPFQQLSDIYPTELNDVEQAQYYQNKANQIRKFL